MTASDDGLMTRTSSPSYGQQSSPTELHLSSSICDEALKTSCVVVVVVVVVVAVAVAVVVAGE